MLGFLSKGILACLLYFSKYHCFTDMLPRKSLVTGEGKVLWNTGIRPSPEGNIFQEKRFAMGGQSFHVFFSLNCDNFTSSQWLVFI